MNSFYERATLWLSFVFLGAMISGTATAAPPSKRPPAAPSSLTATLSSQQVNLSFKDNSRYETGVDVERSIGGAAFVKIATLGVNVTKYTDTQFSTTATNTYRVRAFNSYGTSSYSNTASVTVPSEPAPQETTPEEPTPVVTIPSAPTQLAASATSGQISLSFTDNSSNESGFEIERALGGVPFAKIATLGVNVRTYVDSQVSASTTYSYRVRAINSAGASSYSNTASATTPSDSTTSVPAIPSLDLWKSRMADGKKYCVKSEIDAAINANGVSTEANVWYYDGAHVYRQIAQYTGDSSYMTCSGYVNSAYRSWVLSMTNGVTYPVGKLSGWRVFPHGLLSDFQSTGDANSKEAVKRLSLYSAWAGTGGGAHCGLSRETAYLIQAYLAGEKIGLARNGNLGTAVNYALGHIDQWFVSKSCDNSNSQPFMVGLTLAALIEYHQATNDSRIPAAIKTALDGLWSSFWVSSSKAFIMNKADTSPAPDLNLLIAPAYAWYWNRTGDSVYQQRGDEVFSGGVNGTTFWSGKQFSQNYRWSFDYVKWRSGR